MIEIRNLTRTYAEVPVVDDVSLDVAAGSITVVVGTSGSGKSTLLRMINRLVEPTAGTVRIEGVETAGIPGHVLRRRIGYVIQGYGLFPHRTVARNIATVPRLIGWDRARIDARVDELLTLFQLEPASYASKYPHQLSGGEQQRVGVARALAAEPRVLLMDEPFGALDPIIRAKAQEDLLAIQRRFGTTIVMVTHDMDEAFRLGDRIAVMSEGRILQDAVPATVLARPAPGFVERLVGTTDRPFRLLALSTVADAVESGVADGPALAPEMNLRDALARLVWLGAESLPVEGRPGRITVAGLLQRAREPLATDHSMAIVTRAQPPPAGSQSASGASAR